MRKHIHMKVVFATPEYHQSRGNTVTVKRIRKHMQQKGVQTDVISLTDSTCTHIPDSADLIHGFNAFRFGKYWEKVGDDSLPYMVTMTGTDLNHDMLDERRMRYVVETLLGAEKIHLFTHKARHTLIHRLPEVKEKTVAIPQGVSILPPAEAIVRKEPGTCLFLLPAGIRKVKNVPEAIEMLEPVQRRHEHVRLWIVGPVIEQTEGERVQELVAQHRSWVTYVGEVPFEQMGGLYRQADIGLNTSLSEGQSAAILEMMAHGIPVLAAENEGNEAIIMHDETGLLYKNHDQFQQFAEALMMDHRLRERLIEKAQNDIERHHNIEKEIKELLHIYSSIVYNGCRSL